MTSNRMVSIIVPVYNGEKTLTACLDSLLNQNYDDYEVVIVDNGSTDKTKEIILDCQKHNSRINYAFEPVRGISRARRRGEALARGEVILMTDADCVVPTDWVERMTKPIFLQNVDASQGVEDDGRYFNGIGLKQRSVVGRINTNNFAIKKKIISSLDFRDADFIRGDDLYLSILLHQNKVSVLPLDVAVNHLYENSFLGLVKKHWLAGYYSARLAKKYYDDIKDTDFLNITNQTWADFFKFFPGVAWNFLKGKNDLHYDFLMGLGWRFGLVHFWLENWWLKIWHHKK